MRLLTIAAILVGFFVVSILLRKYVNYEKILSVTKTKVSVQVPHERRYCSKELGGIWTDKGCTCTYKDLLTNNNYNGDCTKVAKQGCKSIQFVSAGGASYKDKKFTCVCKRPYMMFDTNLGECVLGRIEDGLCANGTLKNGTCTCDKGYKLELGECVKNPISWNVLNPDQALKSCDIREGLVSINLIGSGQATSMCAHLFDVNFQRYFKIHVVDGREFYRFHKNQNRIKSVKWPEYVFIENTNSLKTVKDAKDVNVKVIHLPKFLTIEIEKSDPNKYETGKIDPNDYKKIYNDAVEKNHKTKELSLTEGKLPLYEIVMKERELIKFERKYVLFYDKINNSVTYHEEYF